MGRYYPHDINMTYKDYLIEEYYIKDPKVKTYQSFENWLDDQDVDDIVKWADNYVKSYQVLYP